MTISFFHIRVKNNVPHLLTPPYFENRRVTAEKVVSKGVTINYALTIIHFEKSHLSRKKMIFPWLMTTHFSMYENILENILENRDWRGALAVSFSRVENDIFSSRTHFFFGAPLCNALAVGNGLKYVGRSISPDDTPYGIYQSVGLNVPDGLSVGILVTCYVVVLYCIVYVHTCETLVITRLVVYVRRNVCECNVNVSSLVHAHRDTSMPR